MSRLYINAFTFSLCGVLIINCSCQSAVKILDIKSTVRTENSTGRGVNCTLPSVVKSRYRAIDGTCNNVANPMWGAALSPYARLLPPKYGDGVSSFPKSTRGCPLPNARKLRITNFPDKVVNNMEYTLITMQWGQIVAHDMSLTAGIQQTKTTPNMTCCDADGSFNELSKTNSKCAPIRIFKTDPVYSPIDKVCMDFMRTNTTRDVPNTGPTSPAQQLTSVTGYLDLSIVYGNDKATESNVRAWQFGRLKSVMRDGQEWPPQVPQPDQTCDLLETPDSPCYACGDVRANQNSQLTVLQVVLLREHNRMADILAKLNPHWNDEIIFQETRRILIAVSQHITYYNYLPNILGYDNMVENNLIYPNASCYINDYNAEVDASVLNEHATSAFRYFHTNIQGMLMKYSESRKRLGAIRLSDNMNNPTVLERDDGFNTLARGLATQFEAESDKYFDEEVGEYLFKSDNEFGDDLRAIDIQRSRDHGLPSYRDMRAACGLPVPLTFEDMKKYIPPESVQKLREMYASVEDVDLIVGGALEYTAPDAQTGATFLTISTTQFFRTRVGDRFFYERGDDSNIAFNPYQLKSIRESSLAKLLCDNVPGLHSVQPDVFKKISDKNKVVPCARLPSVNLTLWKEDTIIQGQTI